MEVNVVETLVKLLQAEEETEELPEQVSCEDCPKSLYPDSNVTTKYTR